MENKSDFEVDAGLEALREQSFEWDGESGTNSITVETQGKIFCFEFDVDEYEYNEDNTIRYPYDLKHIRMNGVLLTDEKQNQFNQMLADGEFLFEKYYEPDYWRD